MGTILLAFRRKGKDDLMECRTGRNHGLNGFNGYCLNCDSYDFEISVIIFQLTFPIPHS